MSCKDGKIIEQLKRWMSFVLGKARYCVEDANEAQHDSIYISSCKGAK